MNNDGRPFFVHLPIIPHRPIGKMVDEKGRCLFHTEGGDVTASIVHFSYEVEIISPDMQMLTTPTLELNVDRCETFSDFVYGSLIELAPAIDFTVRLLHPHGLDTQTNLMLHDMNGFDLLAYDLSCIGISFAYADHNIAYEESVLLSGLAYLLKNHTSRLFAKLSMAAFVRVKENQNWYISLTGFNLIAQYDHIFEASQADALRLLYYRFAEEMVVADGLITPEESARLLELKSYLYPCAEPESTTLPAQSNLAFPPDTLDVPSSQPMQDKNAETGVTVTK